MFHFFVAGARACLWVPTNANSVLPPSPNSGYSRLHRGALGVMKSLLLALGLCACALAQDTRAILEGQVADPSEAVIAGATVRAGNAKTGYAQTQAPPRRAPGAWPCRWANTTCGSALRTSKRSARPASSTTSARRARSSSRSRRSSDGRWDRPPACRGQPKLPAQLCRKRSCRTVAQALPPAFREAQAPPPVVGGRLMVDGRRLMADG